jgi:hypothetical protein
VGFSPQPTGVSKNFSAQSQNCREVLQKVSGGAQQRYRIFTPKSRVFDLSKNSIATLTQQSANYAGDVRMVCTEAFARFVRPMTDCADMVLEGVNKVPLSNREIIKFQMRCATIHQFTP